MGEKLRVLVVEDDQSTREMYVEVFRNQGMDVSEAEDGKVGLEKATEEIPDVIFTAISMPNLSGFEMMEALKKNEKTAGIPIVISSHLGKEADRERSVELGARDFIIRGFTPPKQVAERLKELFEESGAYHIPFDSSASDASRIAKDLGLEDDFRCLKCGERMVLRLNLKDRAEKTFEARLICPNCGWEAGKEGNK